MKRAKFETLEKQRYFFIKAKKKLGFGSKKLAEKLGLKSRGSIESYTFMRTAPPAEIVKKIEELSGIKGKYREIEGKVYRKKREFTPMNPKDAEDILKEKFKKDFNYIEDLIKSNRDIKSIIKKIRKKGYSFDNSKISRSIGAYRTNLRSKIVDEITPKKEELIINGFIRKDKKTLSINFNLFPLYKVIKKEKIRVGLEISKDKKRIRFFPLKFGRNLIKQSKAIKILLTEKSGLKLKSTIEVILNPKDFGLSIFDSIYDVDAKPLAKEALKQGFSLDKYRSTPNNHKGDLSLYFKNLNIIIEITRMSARQGQYFKVGQCFIQKNIWSKSQHFLICRKKLLRKTSLDAFKKLRVKVINTDFDNDWQIKIIKNIKETLKNDK